MSSIGCVVVDSLQCPTIPTTETFISKQQDNMFDTAMSDVEISEKTCPRCGQTKPATEFSVDRKSNDGRNYYCKQCCNKAAKKLRDKHKHDPRYIYKRIKARQKYYSKNMSTREKPFSIESKEFIAWYENEPKKCHYCDLEEKYVTVIEDSSLQKVGCLTVDCMDNNLGYTLGNIVLACSRCNFIKNNILTHEEMLYIGKNFIKPKWEAKLNE